VDSVLPAGPVAPSRAAAQPTAPARWLPGHHASVAATHVHLRPAFIRLAAGPSGAMGTRARCGSLWPTTAVVVQLADL